jgi:hypothetical protein
MVLIIIALQAGQPSHPPLVIDLLSQATRIHSPPDLIMLVIILCGRLMKPALDQIGNDLRAATVEPHTR